MCAWARELYVHPSIHCLLVFVLLPCVMYSFVIANIITLRNMKYLFYFYLNACHSLLLCLFLIYIYNINLLLFFATSTSSKIIPKRMVWCYHCCSCCCYLLVLFENEWTHCASMRWVLHIRYEMRWEVQKESNKDKQAQNASNHNVFEWWSFIFAVDEREHIFMIYRNKILYTDSWFNSMVIIIIIMVCVCTSVQVVWLFGFFVIPLDSLIHIYVFECVSEFNFLEHLSYDIMYAKAFSENHRNQILPNRCMNAL